MLRSRKLKIATLRSASLAELTQQASREPPDGWSEVDCVPDDPQPYTLDDHDMLRERVRTGDITADQLRSEFQRLRHTREAFIGALQQQYKPRWLRVLAGRHERCAKLPEESRPSLLPPGNASPDKGTIC